MDKSKFILFLIVSVRFLFLGGFGNFIFTLRAGLFSI